MGQPVRLSDELVLDARLTAEASSRSIAGQIEYWSAIGRAVERLILGHKALELCRTVKTLPLSKILDTADSPGGHERLQATLESLPFPHYEHAGDGTRMLIRIEADGTRTVGRFVNRQFEKVPER